MKLPLYSRILLWFLLNVAVLAALFFGVLRWQFREGLHGVLGGMAGDRLQAIGQQMYAALGSQPRTQWADLVRALGRKHDAQVVLVTPPDQIVAGDVLEIPGKVRDMLVAMHPELMHRRGPDGPPGAPPPGGPPDHPPPPRDALEEFLFGGIPGDRPPHERPPPEGQPVMPVRLGTFMIAAGTPERYWTGIRLPLPTGWQRRDGPLLLLIVTRSMTGGGLFFDVRPWLGAVFGAMAISALLWLPFVRGITRTVRQSMRATEKIARGQFDVRVPEGRGDELGRLAQAVNQMAVQLHGLVRGQKRFLGDIAHELCSPVARMEMSLGILEQRLDGAHAERLQDVRQELREMSALVNELLSFSKAAIGQAEKPAQAVDLAAVVQEAARMEEVPAALLHVTIPAGTSVKSRGDLLRRAIGNVLRNSLHHAPGCRIDITAARRGDGVRLTIADQGPGVPGESLPRLFDPFYRIDASRTRDTGGTGLGLSIVKSCVESCGGSTTAHNRTPVGLEIIMDLARG